MLIDIENYAIFRVGIGIMIVNRFLSYREYENRLVFAMITICIF